MKCPVCETELSENIDKCPTCKADIKKYLHGDFLPKKGTNPVLYALLFIIIITILGIVLSRGGKDKKHNTPDNIEAYSMAELFIKEKLKTPSTVKFPTVSNTTIHKNGFVWDINGFFDSQNIYSAYVRSNYSARIRYDSISGKWFLLDIKIEEK